MSPIEDHVSESFVGTCKATCQRCDVNLTRIHLLLEVLEHNSKQKRETWLSVGLEVIRT